jgi:ribonuclease P protein component
VARFPKIVTLKRQQEIESLGRQGLQVTSALFVLVYRPRDEGPSRLVLKVPRRLGTAVVRNLLRRQLREILRPLFANMQRPVDLMVVVRPPAVEALFHEKASDIARMLALRKLLAVRAA